jgi:beta-lactamase regulating signal transducer with metallopeptidase domain
MNGIETLLGKPAFQALGWTLIHFIWEGALVAILYASVSVLLRRSTANVRYAAACFAMLLMLIAPAATMVAVTRATSFAGQPAPTADSAQASSVIARSADDRKPAAFGASEGQSPSGAQASPAKQWVADRLPRAMPWLLALWFLGVLLLSLRFAGGLLTARRLKRVETSATVQFWQEKLAVLCTRLRVSRPVRLCESALVEVPTVIGWLRPVILIPVSAMTGLSAEQLEALLAHELAHIRRCDYLVNLVQTTIETLLFYHPAVWWVSRQVRQEREHCCDDLAVDTCGDALTYARALAALEQMRVVAPQIAVAASGGSLLVRIQRLLRHRAPARNGFQNWLAGVLALATIVALLAGAETALLARNVKAAAAEDPIAMTLPAGLPQVAGQSADSIARKVDREPQSQASNHTEEASPVGTVAEVQAPDDHAQVDTPKADMPAQDQDSSTQDFISEMAAAGFTNLKIDQLVALKMHGVTAQFVRGIATLLAKQPTVDEVVSMRIHGVTAAYANEFKALGLTGLDADRLVAFAIHGVTPRFINELKAAGYGSVDSDSLIMFRIHGVTPEYIQHMKDLGFAGLKADQLAAFRIHNVSPEFIQSMRSILRGNLTADDLTGLRIHGVSPEFIKGLESIGYTNMTADQLMGFRIHGVTPAFIGAIQQAGYPRITADQLNELRMSGVTPEFIQTVKSHGFADVTIEQLVELRRLNIIPSSRKK